MTRSVRHTGYGGATAHHRAGSRCARRGDRRAGVGRHGLPAGAGARLRARWAAPCRSWPSGRTAPWGSRTARPPRVRSRRSSTWKTRSTANTGWKSRRRASIGRWCGARTSSAMPAMRRRSKWRSPQDGRKRFRGILTGVEGEAAQAAPQGRGRRRAGRRAAADRRHGRGAARADRRTGPRIAAAGTRRARERHADNDNRLPGHAAHANGNEGD